MQIILLLAMRYRDGKSLENVYDLIVKIAEDLDYVNALINCQNYEEFIMLLYEIRESNINQEG